MKKTIMFVAVLMAMTLAACSGQQAAPSVSSEPASSVEEQNSSTPSSQADKEEVELYISAAASLTESMNKIAELYKEQAPNVTLTLNFASSGTLQKQIEESAPSDVFLSAAQKQMDALAGEDLIMPDTRKDILVNKVVLVVPKGSDKGIAGFDDIFTDKVSMVAIGDPDSVPVGQYAKEVFTSMNQWDAVQSKLNLAADVKEVLSWTETGNVDCGIVYSTDAATSDGVDVVVEAPEGSHKAVVYPAAVLKNSTHQEEAKAFLDYLSGDVAKKIFEENGFTAA